MNAIAKGFACDLVADGLARLGITDLLVEIGGEIVARDSTRNANHGE